MSAASDWEESTMANMIATKTPMPEQEPQIRNKNFKEVAIGYTKEMAVGEAKRCLNCKHKPCVSGCPVNVRIPEFLAKVAEEKFEEAYQIILSTNRLPAVCGRVCPQEPKAIVKTEVDNLIKLGVDLKTDYIVGRTITVDEVFEEGYEAVFIGSGAGLPSFMNIPGENLLGVYSANEYLTRTNLMHAYDEEYMTPIYHGNSVAVVGGGNVAMDAARCAKRLGAENVYIVYRRSMEELPARAEEVHHAQEEGIIFKLLNNPVAIHGDENGHVKAIECVEMELGEPDASGRRRPIEKKGSNFEIPVDAVIMSIGTSPNPLIKNTTPGIEVNRKGCLVCTEDAATTREGVYAGGDAVTGAATVILAMGAGKTAAASIDEYIRNKAK